MEQVERQRTATHVRAEVVARHHQTRDLVEATAAIAARQRGVISREQAIAAGCGRTWIDKQLAEARWFSVHQGVFAVGHPGLSRRGAAIAALLRAGDGAALSHESAARLWGLVSPRTDGPIHLSILARRGLESSRGVVVHRPRTLRPEDVVERNGLLVTTPERTVIDLLRTSSVPEITRLLEQMVTQLGRSPDDLHAWGRALPRRPGRTKLLEALDHVVGPAVLRSELERAFRTLCQHAGLPMPRTNVKIGRWELDVLFPEHGVGIELDSWRWHGGSWQFHRDRRKGLALGRAGIELLRVTWPQVKHESAEVVDTLTAVLARKDPATRLPWRI